MEKWANVTDTLYIWFYETNYHFYMFPINTYDTMTETFRFAKSAGAIYMFPEGQFNQGSVTHFTRYKEYLDAKILWDLSLNPGELMNDYFDNYFGPASEPMRMFYEEMQAQLEWIEATYPTQISGTIYDEIGTATSTIYWPKRQLDHWIELTEEAYDMIDHLKILNPKMYEVYREHILLETMFPRFAQISLYETAYSANTMAKMKSSFKSDARKLKITMRSELAPLAEYMSNW